MKCLPDALLSSIHCKFTSQQGKQKGLIIDGRVLEGYDVLYNVSKMQQGLLYINKDMAYMHEQSDEVKDNIVAIFDYHFNFCAPGTRARFSTSIPCERLSAESGDRRFFTSSPVGLPNAGDIEHRVTLDHLLTKGSSSGGRTHTRRFISGNTAHRHIVDKYAPNIPKTGERQGIKTGYVCANTQKLTDRGNVVTLRHFPGHLEPRATFFSLSEAERIAGVPDDYTAACDVAERFALLAQVVPVSVQAHVLSYMKFRVGPSRLSSEKNEANIEQLTAYIEATEANLARAKEELRLAYAGRRDA